MGTMSRCQTAATPLLSKAIILDSYVSCLGIVGAVSRVVAAGVESPSLEIVHVCRVRVKERVWVKIDAGGRVRTAREVEWEEEEDGTENMLNVQTQAARQWGREEMRRTGMFQGRSATCVPADALLACHVGTALS